jgi:hypothetical protein
VDFFCFLLTLLLLLLLVLLPRTQLNSLSLHLMWKIVMGLIPLHTEPPIDAVALDDPPLRPPDRGRRMDGDPLANWELIAIQVPLGSSPRRIVESTITNAKVVDGDPIEDAPISASISNDEAQTHTITEDT